MFDINKKNPTALVVEGKELVLIGEYDMSLCTMTQIRKDWTQPKALSSLQVYVYLINKKEMNGKF